MSLVLQLRDLGILESIQKYGVVSSSQLGHWYFPNIAKTTVLKRLRLLEKGNYIKRGVPLDDGTNSFYLGREGHRILQTIPVKVGINRNTIGHDVLLSQVLWKLESFGLAKDVTPEFQLRSEVFRNNSYRNAKEQLIPDALMIESVRGTPLAISIELELTIKSESRYKKIFEHYGSKKAISKMWYICRDLRSINKILQMSRKSYFNFKDRLWLSAVDDFTNEKEPSIWSANSGQWHNLSSIGFNNFKMPAQAPTQGVSKFEPINLKTKTEDKSPEFGDNSSFLTSLREAPPAPDHSPSTMESGQEHTAGKENKKLELNTVGGNKNNELDEELKRVG